MKPKLWKFDQRWFCTGSFTVGIGATAREAYNDWVVSKLRWNVK